MTTREARANAIPIQLSWGACCSHKVAIDCELCGHVDWGYVGTDAADGLALPLRRATSVDLGTAFLTYAVSCKSCGNVRLMSKNRVEELAGRDPSLG